MKTLVKKFMPSLSKSLSKLYWEFYWRLQDRVLDVDDIKKFDYQLSALLRGAPRQAPPSGDRVLILTVAGNAFAVAVECVLTVELLKKGAAVKFVICDEELPFCSTSNIHAETLRPCAYCMRLKRRLLKHFDSRPLGPPAGDAQKRVEAIPGQATTIRQCMDFAWRGLPIGRYCVESLQWCFCRSAILESDLPYFQKLLQASAIIVERMAAILEEEKPGCVVLFNGCFFPERITEALCRERGIRTVMFEAGFFPQKFFVSTREPAYALSVDDTFPRVKDRPLAAGQRRKVRRVLQDRERLGPSLFGVPLVRGMEKGTGKVLADLGLGGLEFAAAFTNMTWDSSILGRESVFPSMFEWLRHAIDFFARHPEWGLVIRCHPGEVGFEAYETETAERAETFIHGQYARLPDNVRVVSAESKLSSYVLMREARLGLVFSSTTGMEMSWRGKPVVSAAGSYYGGYGLTFEPKSSDEYFALIARHMATPFDQAREFAERVERYAYHLFFEKMLPLDPLQYNVDTARLVFKPLFRRLLSPRGGRGIEVFRDCVLGKGEPVIWRRTKA